MLLCLPAGSPIAFNQVGFVARLVRMYGGPPVTSGWQLPPIALLDVSRRVLSLDAGGPVAGRHGKTGGNKTILDEWCSPRHFRRWSCGGGGR